MSLSSKILEYQHKVRGVTFTPKIHSLMKHACKCQRLFGGLGDKTEQNIEKRHQDQKLMTARMYGQKHNFEQRLQKQYYKSGNN